MAKKRLAKKKTARKATRKKTVSRSAAKRKQQVVPKKKTKAKPKTTRVRKSASANLEASIRNLDREILKLINKRAATTTKLIERSPNRQQLLFDPHSDDEMWARLADVNPGPLSADSIRGVFREIISSARNKVKTHRVIYLGPPYSFTHLAAIERFGGSADLIPVSTIAAVFEEVNHGRAEFGIVPIENSTDGRVVDTLDMFTRLPLRICGEIQINVHHNLLARCPRGEISEIYSKPQALSQCRDWLAKNMPHARLIEVTSTSTAAQLAQTKQGVAAVASQQAAVKYELQIVADKIEDNPDNITRFAIIGEENSRPTGADRTAILLQIPHQPGSLSEALVAFKKNKVNLTWIESFPLRGPESGYLFFLDFEGHKNEAKTKRTLAELEKRAVRMELLGSYPRSEPIG